MKKELIERLLALNHTFYQALAGPFSASRTAADPALASILPYIPQGASVLDVGCGNGRLALLLGRERPGTTYVGVDAVPELIDLARSAATQARVAATFYTADIARPGWAELLSPGRYDRVVALAVLHHLPGYDLRLRVVREMAGLLQPEGLLIFSTWHFLSGERTRRKVVPWATLGIAEEELERGDYLLDWKRGGYGLRYCHLLDEQEVDRLAAESGLEPVEEFGTGGREGELGRGYCFKIR